MFAYIFETIGWVPWYVSMLMIVPVAITIVFCIIRIVMSLLGLIRGIFF